MPLDSPLPQANQNTAATRPALTGPGAKLAKLTISLTELIAEETKLLKKRLTKDAQRLHGQKNRLMAEYREVLNSLQVNDKLLGPKNSAARVYIRELTDKFRETLRDHARIVLRLKSVAEGIIKSVGEEVIKKNRPVVAYGQNAAYNMPTHNRPTSLQLNQVI
jgi:hypothetical protein